ncbi:hypothetical protein PR202_ga25717 [Eleusine coracana subsp. coracana]|uniref:Uncharacterized protein n=1 Tax=Eleusine coracana subsp. coracana TaxID=191504 RepID=A0AAV5DC27_ELECO|nr:hypothetical protein PR202_ga25717 [Eleusine coracana subsp. coracana]
MANGGCLLMPGFCAAIMSRGRRRRRRRSARLVLWGGETSLARHGKLAGQDRLLAGRTYLVLPVDRLPQGCDALTAASLAALSYDRGRPGAPGIAGGPRSPFEYVKADDGRTVIKVTPEFIVAAVTSKAGTAAHGRGGGESCGALCSTPELRKHYEQLVGAGRGRAWSPRLDTIKERKGRRGLDDFVLAVSPGRLSPVAVRLLGLEGKGER